MGEPRRHDVIAFTLAAWAFRLLNLWPRRLLDAYCSVLERVVNLRG